MKFIFLVCLMGIFCTLSAQTTPWVDTLYGHYDTLDVYYGTSRDFAGNMKDLEMDISVPVGDTPPASGRPLMVLVHGGAWISGDKAGGFMPRMREEFSQRGYLVASVNYRLGLINTNSDINCNISYFGIPWNCLQMQDTTEWIRANYRAQQDVRGAIRYLVAHKTDYNIDPGNVFVVGESAGGFIAMSVGYLDHPSEVPPGVGALPDALPPNNRYTPCIQQFSTTIAAMDLSRPDLGPPEGDLNLISEGYCIRGVGSIYGGRIYSLFDSTSYDVEPALYMYHQPADKIVSINRQKLLSGYSGCAYGVCQQGIFHTPFSSGGLAIRSELDTLQVYGYQVPDYMDDFTTNNWNCFDQTFGGQNGHSLDSYWLRTTNMAAFFAPYMNYGGCDGLVDVVPAQSEWLRVYPVPASSAFRVELSSGREISGVEVYNSVGKRVWRTDDPAPDGKVNVTLPLDWTKGYYIVRVVTGKGESQFRKILVTN